MKLAAFIALLFISVPSFAQNEVLPENRMFGIGTLDIGLEVLAQHAYDYKATLLRKLGKEFNELPPANPRHGISDVTVHDRLFAIFAVAPLIEDLSARASSPHRDLYESSLGFQKLHFSFSGMGALTATPGSLIIAIHGIHAGLHACQDFIPADGTDREAYLKFTGILGRSVAKINAGSTFEALKILKDNMGAADLTTFMDRLIAIERTHGIGIYVKTLFEWIGASF